MGKNIALIISVMLVLVLGATVFAVQTRFQREMIELHQLLEKQEEELGILRADNAYLKSQTTEISVLEEELSSKRGEIDALKKKSEEQQEMITSFEGRLTEMGNLQEQLDKLAQENERLRLAAEKKTVEGLEPGLAEFSKEEAPASNGGSGVESEGDLNSGDNGKADLQEGTDQGDQEAQPVLEESGGYPGNEGVPSKKLR